MAATDSEPPRPTPLDVDGVGAITVGTASWAVLTIIAVFTRTTLTADGHGWWLRVAGTATILGMMGLAYVLRRRSKYRAANN